MNNKEGVTWVFPFIVIAAILVFITSVGIYKYSVNIRVGELKSDLGYYCVGVEGLTTFKDNSTINCSAIKQGNFTISEAFLENTPSN